MIKEIPSELLSKFEYLISQKVEGKLHYSSSPDRALQNLLYLLPFIQDKVPNMKLHIDVYYGMENLAISNPELANSLKALIKTAGDDVVNFKGRVGQKELAESWKKAYLWLYPTWFSETYCWKNASITTENGLVEIENININDKVVTHTSELKNVIEVHKNEYNGKLINIEAKYLYKSIEVTPNHPFLVLKRSESKCKRDDHKSAFCNKQKAICHACNTKSYNYNSSCSNIGKVFELGWYEAQNVEVGDYLAYPKIKEQNEPPVLSSLSSQQLHDYYLDGMATKINDMHIDENIMELFGWYTAEGSFDGRSIITFSLNIDEIKEAEFIQQQLLNLGLESRIDTVENVRKVVTHSAYLGRILNNNFGKGARNKKIPLWVKKLHNKYIISFLRGLYLGDGNSSRTTIKLECASENLILDINDCLLKLGCISSLTEINKPNIKRVGKKIVKTDGFSKFWSVTTSNGQPNINNILKIKTHNGAPNLICCDDRYVYYKITKKFETNYTGYVYNIGVEGNHSYIANNIISHNCITANEAMLSATPILCSNEAALQTTVGDYGTRISGHAHSLDSRIACVDEAAKLLNNKDYWIECAKKSFLGSLQGIDWETRYKKHWKTLL